MRRALSQWRAAVRSALFYYANDPAAADLLRCKSHSERLCVETVGASRNKSRTVSRMWRSARLDSLLHLFVWFGALDGRNRMNSPCYPVAMDVGVCQLRSFSISFLSSVLGAESSTPVSLDNRWISRSDIDDDVITAVDAVVRREGMSLRECDLMWCDVM